MSMWDHVWHEALNPLDFLERSAFVYPDKAAVVYRDTRYTYGEFYARVNQLAGALKQAGVHRGDRVAFLVPNVPAMLEGHYGPLRLGAILVAINIRLSPREAAYILNHSGAKVLVFDAEFAPTVRAIREEIQGVSTFVQVVDAAPKADDIPGPDYESFLAAAPAGDHRAELGSEKDTICINYTSGTTGMPKGVQYHARGAYLNALGEALEVGLNYKSHYLWTLPMFHCNGWCFTWGVTAVGGTHICLRHVDPAEIFRLIREVGVTHMCGAPTVLIGMSTSPAAEGQSLAGVTIVTAGAPPAPQMIRTMEGLGATIHHVYGLTETYGPHTICAFQPGWDNLSLEQRATVKACQGVPYIVAGMGMRVVDNAMHDVPHDGQTMGEVVMRGNNVMKAYYRDERATAEAFRGGWFHSGDLGVMHPDGYIELRDRAKDIIISGGENISTIEVEGALVRHPDVLEAAVVAIPDEKWGERPKGFVTLRPGATLSEAELIAFSRETLPGFKAPSEIDFCALPKTSTGKIKKFELRERARRRSQAPASRA
jgi:fatty-acyl-CoA synthase